MAEETYVCSECGTVVVIEQHCYDKLDFDHKCSKCYYESQQ